MTILECDSTTQAADFSILLGDVLELTAEEETQAALDEMQRDATFHLATPALRYIGATPGGGNIAALAVVVMPHLIQCRRCRSVLKQMLQLIHAPQEHFGYRLLEDADEAAQWQAAGNVAAEAARKTLTEQGIGYVYGRAGTVYRRQPDGREELASGQETMVF